MKTAVAHLESVSPYSQSNFFKSTKSRDETHGEFEARCWRERIHADKDGNAYIPPMQFKGCIAQAAKYKSLQIPGKGKATYTKHFKSGILVVEPLMLGVKSSDVDCERLMLDAQPGSGRGGRVEKFMPVFTEWSGDVSFLILDETINEDVFLTHLADAGQFIGIGRFRPACGGFYGRFKVNGVDWS